MIEFSLIQGDDRLIVIPGEESEIKAVCERTGASVLAIRNLDWNRDLSPWPADKVFRKGEDFTGQGADTLQAIEEWLNRNGGGYRTVIIAGYSLAGLFALYAAAEMAGFAGLASTPGASLVQFAVILGIVAEEDDVGCCLTNKILFGAPLVAIFTHQVDDVVARPTREECLFGPVALQIGRATPDDVCGKLFGDVVVGHAEECLVLIVSAKFLAPPEP